MIPLRNLLISDAGSRVPRVRILEVVPLQCGCRVVAKKTAPGAMQTKNEKH